MSNNILVSYDTFNKYLLENKTPRLTKNTKIYTFLEFRRKMFESFDKTYPDTKYTIQEYVFESEFSNANNGNGYQIFFETNSSTEYRIDIIPIKNYNNKINSPFVWNLSFTTSNNSLFDDNYEDLTNLNETREVLSRIGNILSRLDIMKYFIIGQTELEKKLKLYKTFLALVFPNYNIEMNYCLGFINNTGLYIY